MTRTVAWFAAAAAVAAVALSPQLDARADASFAWHMAQHLALIFAIPLLVLLGHPFQAFAALAGKRRTAALVRSTRPLHALARTPVALGIFVATLWVAHYSPLYELALEHPAVHLGEHALFFLAGTVFWLPILAPAPLKPPSYPERLIYLFLALPQGALLGAALDTARAPLYAHYVAIGGTAWALADQRNGAAVMWLAGGLIVFCTLLATLGVWARRETLAMRSAAAIAVAAGIAAWGNAASAAPAPATGAIPSFTPAQARIGRILYYENCAECHGAKLEGNIGPALAGGNGNLQWDTVTYVWTYMTQHMPAGNAGGLRKQEYLEIMAFLLREHGHAPGAAPLSESAASASKALLGP